MQTDGLLETSVNQLMGKEGFCKVNKNEKQVLESQIFSDFFARKNSFDNLGFNTSAGSKIHDINQQIRRHT